MIACRRVTAYAVCAESTQHLWLNTDGRGGDKPELRSASGYQLEWVVMPSANKCQDDVGSQHVPVMLTKIRVDLGGGAVGVPRGAPNLASVGTASGQCRRYRFTCYIGRTVLHCHFDATSQVRRVTERRQVAFAVAVGHSAIRMTERLVLTAMASSNKTSVPCRLAGLPSPDDDLEFEMG